MEKKKKAAKKAGYVDAIAGEILTLDWRQRVQLLVCIFGPIVDQLNVVIDDQSFQMEMINEFQELGKIDLVRKMIRGFKMSREHAEEDQKLYRDLGMGLKSFGIDTEGKEVV